MSSLDYVHVDVFSPAPYSGNSLAVFPDAGALAPDQMLRITQELRHFETIFLEPTPRPHFVRARVFDLFEELPFAGHPIIGAAAVLQHRSGQAFAQTWGFELPGKSVSVAVQRTGDGYSGLLDQGQPEFLGEARDRRAVARAFSLDLDDLHGEAPLEVVSTGLRYLVIPVGPNVLDRARVAHDLTEMLRAQGAQFAVLWDEAAQEARHWNNDGVMEDVATGSAAGTIGAYRLKHGLAVGGEDFVIHQGRFTGRPSRLLVHPEGCRDAVSTVKVGGQVSLVGHGVLSTLPPRQGLAA